MAPRAALATSPGHPLLAGAAGSTLTKRGEVERSSQGISLAGAERDSVDVAGLHGRTLLISQ